MPAPSLEPPEYDPASSGITGPVPPPAAATRQRSHRPLRDVRGWLPPGCAATVGFLIDLDGTMYRPGGLIDGAIEFYEWLVSTKTPHVFLSNTGAKGSPGVQTKFKSERYRLSSKPVPLRNIWTASEAQMDLMMHKKEDTPDSAKGSQRDYGLPHGAKVFVMAGGEGFWLNSLRMKDSMRFDSWDIRTTLTNDEAKAWAKEARDSQEAGECTVFVVLFLDGKLDKVDVVDGDVSGRSADYRGDWNYGLIRNVSFLLHHGAQLIYTADDAFNPSEDPEYPGMACTAQTPRGQSCGRPLIAQTFVGLPAPGPWHVCGDDEVFDGARRGRADCVRGQGRIAWCAAERLHPPSNSPLPSPHQA